jgi:benzoylformate decarboxylase
MFSYRTLALGDTGARVSERTVRDATFDVLRDRGLTTIFGNPGSTEVPFLAGFPDDLRFVLALHEASVVGLATGWALGRGEPAIALLHTTAGIGNAVAALATARVNRAPLVVLVGQQDRRHLALEPFLAGRLENLAGDYPVHIDLPLLARDVPGALDRAWHEATTGRGPALVIVPMDDWLEPAGDAEAASPRRMLRPSAGDEQTVAELTTLLEGSESPAIVAGAGAADADTWAALIALAERLGCPVWQEAFGARPGFPQDHPLFAGFLPADRAGLRAALAGRDVVLSVGAPVFRQYPFTPGALVESGTRVVVVTDDPAEAHRSPADLAVLATPAAICAQLAERLSQREHGTQHPLFDRLEPPAAPRAGARIRAGHVLFALADRLPADAVIVEETPSNRPELHNRIPARSPLGFVSAAMGGLGFALPGATGLRMALPDRPVVAVVGDGSSLYTIQALWSAAYYRVGVLFIVLNNGGYAVMDRLAEQHGSAGPWPSFDIEISALAQTFGSEARRIEKHEALLVALDELIPGLATRTEPLVLEVVVEPDSTFRP